MSAPDVYDDGNVRVDESGITLRRYYFPGGSKRIPFERIERLERRNVSPPGSGWLAALGTRIWGTGDFRHWFNLDARRGSKSGVLILDVGRRIRPCATPSDPDAAEQLIRARLPR